MDETPLTTPGGEELRKKGDGGGASWMVGVILILVGVAFLLEQGNYLELTANWWAVFIYLAAFASFANMWRAYRSAGEFTSSAGGSLTWGLVLTVVASIFLFNLEWDLWWPAILIAVGVGILLTYLLRNRMAKPQGSTGR
jgi:drug/metabolite transporter (DMT)-like permease